MKKISAILPVYNEEVLLPFMLKNVSPHLDEIVVIDGSPNGPSDDKTAEIAQSFENVVYKNGTFKTIDGAWDSTLQKNTAIAATTGDIVLFLSADMFFSNMANFREAMLTEEGKIFFCTTIEFWLDTKHTRLYTDSGELLAIQSPLMDVAAVWKSLNPYFSEGQLHIDITTTDERLVAPQTIKYHLGWIRPFMQQVDKHIRHVRQHRWGDVGEKLLRGTESGLVQWAMQHVLGYSNIRSLNTHCVLPPEMEALADMKHTIGSQKAVEDFEEKYGYSVFKPHGREGVRV